MKRMLLFCLLLPVNIAYLFAQGTMEVTTDKASYSYGDSIQVQVTITNKTDSTFTLRGSTTCIVRIGFNSVPFDLTCTADDRDFRFTPGTSRAWFWNLKPSELGIPDKDSLQVIYGYAEGMMDSTIIKAPRYYGGKLSVMLYSAVDSSELQSLRDSFNVEVLYHFYAPYDSSFHETWQITGHSIDSIASVLSKDYRVKSIRAARHLMMEREGLPSPSYTVSGRVIYDNMQSTPLANTYVTIVPHNVITRTGTDGKFKFTYVIKDTHKISVANLPAWGGVNATDALVIGRHASKLDTLKGLKLRAADTDQSGSVNGWDMLEVLKRLTGQGPDWKNKWLFGDSIFVVTDRDIEKDIRGICLGDVNSSYFGLLPQDSSSLIKPVISIDELRVKPGDTVYIALRGKDLINFGAITLRVQYNPDSLKFLEAVDWNREISSALTGSSGGVLTIAYANVNSSTITDGILVRLKFLSSSSLKQTALSFIKEECEIASHAAVPLNVVYNDGKVTTGVEHSSNVVPSEFILRQNHPNPFNPATTISYTLPVQSFAELKIFDILGREIATLVNKVQSAGEYTVQFSGSRLPGGVYIYTIQAGEFRDSKKLMLLK